MDYERPIAQEEVRRISVTFGTLYLITFITSIPALYLFQPVLDDPVGYVTGAGDTNRIVLGAVLELILIIANIGTAVVVYPLLKRENEVLALGYVTARIIESTFILAGILSMLAVAACSRTPLGRISGCSARSPIRGPLSRTGRSCSARASLSGSETDCCSDT